MAGNIVLAAGLLMFIFVHYGKGFSEVVPDGVVYTEVKKTLVQGIPGVLPCRFYGQPYAVYWGMGQDPDNLTPLLVWHEGTKSGPRYSDGSLDIDENYTLLIKNVSMADAGRFYCTVSNYLGILIDNYTDVIVVDTAIVTKSQVTLQMRPYLRGVVQCTVQIRPRTVSWIKKSTTSSSDETLVIFENNGAVVKRGGAGYDEGMYNISEDYSLVISDVQVHNKGFYTCNVTDFDTGIAFQDDTLVNVVAQPREPFPTILECLHDESDLTYCSIPAETALTITCLVGEYYPDINLNFLYGSKKVEILGTRERNNTDGTKNKTITIASHGSKELYTCVAFNIPGTPNNRSTSALLHNKEHFKFLLAVMIPFLAMMFFATLVYVIWRKRHSTYHDVPQQENSELREVCTKDRTPADKRLLEELVNDVLALHYQKICDLTERDEKAEKTDKAEEPEKTEKAEKTDKGEKTENVIDEIKNTLLHADRMCSECHAGMLSSQLTKAFETKDTLRDRTVLDFAWPSDEEIKWISRHITPNSMTDICKKLGIKCKKGDADNESKMFDSLRVWRNKMVNTSIDEKHKLLLSALESNKLRGLLPPIKGRYIYKAELVDMAFQLLMHDLLPITEALGINATKLVSYRPIFQHCHLKIGTTKLLSQLLDSIAPENIEILVKGQRRLIFCNRIGKLHYRKVTTCVVVVYDMSYGELSSVYEAMEQTTAGSDCQGKQERASCGEGSSADATSAQKGDEGDETDIENCDSEKGRLLESKIKIELPKDLYDLQRVLQLTDQDIPDSHESSHPITAFELFKIWKEKPRQSVFNYRAALAHGLKQVKGIDLSDPANDVIAGKYIHEETSLEFIQNMVKGLTRDQLERLGDLLNLSEDKQHSHTSKPIDVISKQIFNWVADWTKEMKNSWYLIKVLTKARYTVAEVTSLKTTLKKHKDLNDKLVEHGFLDLAREIMIIEQQLGYVEPSLKRRIANMTPKDVISQASNLVHDSKFSQLFAH